MINCAASPRCLCRSPSHMGGWALHFCRGLWEVRRGPNWSRGRRELSSQCHKPVRDSLAWPKPHVCTRKGRPGKWYLGVQAAATPSELASWHGGWDTFRRQRNSMACFLHPTPKPGLSRSPTAQARSPVQAWVPALSPPLGPSAPSLAGSLPLSGLAFSRACPQRPHCVHPQIHLEVRTEVILRGSCRWANPC